MASEVLTAIGEVNLGQSEERGGSVHCKEAGSCSGGYIIKIWGIKKVLPWFPFQSNCQLYIIQHTIS